MLIFSGWGLVACCALTLPFGVSLTNLVLLLLSIGLLSFFYRL